MARLHLLSRILEDRAIGKRPADCYCYGHYHVFVESIISDEWLGERRLLRITIAPSMVGLGNFARKTAKSPAYIEHGMVGYDIVPGRIAQVVTFKEGLDLRKEETL